MPLKKEVFVIKIAKIMYNDTTNGQGINVSLWMQGCPHHCKGCHNPETWSFSGGYEQNNLENIILNAINQNGVVRNFSILGGEPLCDENKYIVLSVLLAVRKKFPNIKIYIWTGYTLEYLKNQNDKNIQEILSNIDVLIDGPYIEKLRDITLPLRGSSNQRILYKGKDF